VQTIDRSVILGDDLIVTNRDRLERTVKTSAVNGFILKPNQVGTIAEALGCFEYAAQNAILAIPSGRSGERIEKLNFLLCAAEGIPNCALADVPALVRF
jgi:enolase